MPIDVPDGATTVSDNANVLVGVAGVFTAGAELTGPAVGAPKPGLLLKPAGAGEPKPPELPKPPDCGWPNVEGPP